MSSTQSSTSKEFLHSNQLYKTKNQKYYHEEFTPLDRGIFHYAEELIKQHEKFFSDSPEDRIKRRGQLFGLTPTPTALQDISIKKHRVDLNFLFLIFREVAKQAFVNTKCKSSCESRRLLSTIT
jgi:hypothetical protein